MKKDQNPKKHSRINRIQITNTPQIPYQKTN